MTRAVFLHGMLGDARVWRGVTPALPHLDCEMVELPGHGRAPAWDGSDYQTQALGLLDGQIGEGPVHLVAHSFGATVAMRYAVEHPVRLTSLTLIEPVFHFAARETAPEAFDAYATRFAPVAEALEAQELAQAAEAFLGSWGVPGAWQGLSPQARDAITAQMHLIAASAPSLVEDTGGIWPRLGQIHCPVLLVQGGRSDPVIVAIMAALEDRIARPQTHTLDDAGHMIPLTHGPALGQVLADFTR